MMRPLTDDELALIASDLQELLGAQLQEVVQSEQELGLGFYHRQQIVWLWFDMDSRRPVVLRFLGKPPPRRKLTKPLLLFIRAHLVGRRLQSLAMNVAQGRVLEFSFHDPGGEEFRLEARLFPRGANLSVVAGTKQINLEKPKDLPARPAGVESPMEPRTWEAISAEWENETRGNPQANATTASSAMSEAERAARAWEKTCMKKAQALEKMRADLSAKADPKWREAGELLKMTAALEVPSSYAPYVDLRQSLSWNIETCFRKAKENERKLEGARARIELLDAELASIRAAGPERFARTALAGSVARSGVPVTHSGAQGPGGVAKAKSLLEKAGARGRKLQIADDLEAYIGKSAADNIALLRRAQPHDYWLHLRDHPGAHAILRRAKGRAVSDAELNEVGRWVVMQSLHKSEAELKGGRYDLILAECRFVRPIKGDKLGRVNYQNDRLFVVRV